MGWIRQGASHFLENRLYTAKVMHHRLLPKSNRFSYGVYYLALSLPFDTSQGGLDTGFIQFQPRDVGYRTGKDPTIWVYDILRPYGLLAVTEKIVLVTMPQVMGYVFNPVSFYLCFDDENGLRCVVCEVHNTFGEQHIYICAKPDFSLLTGEDWLQADKIFHVSPFLKREGFYRFRFDVTSDDMKICINYHKDNGDAVLLTSLAGGFMPLTADNLKKVNWRYPLLTIKAMILIHWQALKLVLKKISFYKKPPQRSTVISTTFDLTKK